MVKTSDTSVDTSVDTSKTSCGSQCDQSSLNRFNIMITVVENTVERIECTDVDGKLLLEAVNHLENQNEESGEINNSEDSLTHNKSSIPQVVFRVAEEFDYLNQSEYLKHLPSEIKKEKKSLHQTEDLESQSDEENNEWGFLDQSEYLNPQSEIINKMGFVHRGEDLELPPVKIKTEDLDSQLREIKKERSSLNQSEDGNSQQVQIKIESEDGNSQPVQIKIESEDGNSQPVQIKIESEDLNPQPGVIKKERESLDEIEDLKPPPHEINEWETLFDPRLNPEASEFVFQGYRYSNNENLRKLKIISALQSISFDKIFNSDACEFKEEVYFPNSYISYNIEDQKFVVIQRDWI